MIHIQRTIVVFFTLFALTGCFSTNEPVPENTLSQLNGEWLQNDGAVRVHFYTDETVKLSMPEEQPPLRLLSQLEVLKDSKIGFGVGDRWNGPVHVVPAKDNQHLELIFPGEPDRTLGFHRAIR